MAPSLVLRPPLPRHPRGLALPYIPYTSSSLPFNATRLVHNPGPPLLPLSPLRSVPYTAILFFPPSSRRITRQSAHHSTRSITWGNSSYPPYNHRIPRPPFHPCASTLPAQRWRHPCIIPRYYAFCSIRDDGGLP
jgi:hypothetical protein